MSNISLSGAKTYANQSVRGVAIIAAADTVANTWYEIKSVGATAVTALPIEKVGAVFRSPDGATQITLAVGDSCYPLTLSRLCKTDADISFEEGVIDVTDDCEDGFNANILDGYKSISGTLNGFAKFDDSTGELSTGTADIFKRFINVVTDDSAGTYVEVAASNEKLLLFILLNRNAAVGDVQNWLIVPALISALGTGAGLKDAQKRDLTWSKAQGYTSLYQRTVVAADVIS